MIYFMVAYVAMNSRVPKMLTTVLVARRATVGWLLDKHSATMWVPPTSVAIVRDTSRLSPVDKTAVIRSAKART